MALADATIFTRFPNRGGWGARGKSLSGSTRAFVGTPCGAPDGSWPLIEAAAMTSAAVRRNGYLLEQHQRPAADCATFQSCAVSACRYGVPDREPCTRPRPFERRSRKLARPASFCCGCATSCIFEPANLTTCSTRPSNSGSPERFGYTGDEVVLPVEKFMRDYFHHTGEVRYTASKLYRQARRPKPRWRPCSSDFAPGRRRFSRGAAVSSAPPWARAGQGKRGRVASVAADGPGEPVQQTHRPSHLGGDSPGDGQPAPRSSCPKRPRPASSRSFRSRPSSALSCGGLHQTGVLERARAAMSHARCCCSSTSITSTRSTASLRAVDGPPSVRPTPVLVGKSTRSEAQTHGCPGAAFPHDSGQGLRRRRVPSWAGCERSERKRSVALWTARSRSG